MAPLPAFPLPDLLADLPDRLGMALLHAAWQDTALALAAASALTAMSRRTAAARHALAMGALLAMVAVPAFTAFASPDGGAPSWQALAQPAGVAGAVAQASDPAPGIARVAAWWPRAAHVVVLAWVVGVAAMLARRASGARVLRQLAEASAPSWPPEWRARAARLGQRLGLRRAVALRLVEGVDQPFTAGLLRPIVWMPAALLARLDVDHLEALVAHELAHVRRLDALWLGLQGVAESLLFFHPAAWWLGRRIREERENACDDLAAAACGDGLVVAEALAGLERIRLAPPRAALAAADGGSLRRVRRLLAGSPARPRTGAALAGLAGALLLVAVAARALPPAAASAPEDPWYTQVGDSMRLRLRGDDGHLRDYHRWHGLDGVPHESLRVDGRDVPIDAAARAWIDEHSRPPQPPLPPLPPEPPEPPTAPDAPGTPSMLPIPPLPPVPHVSSHPGYQVLQGRLAADAEVAAMLGLPITLAEDCHPCRLDEDHVELDVSVSGPRGHGRVRAEGHRQGDAWRFDRVEVRDVP